MNGHSSAGWWMRRGRTERFAPGGERAMRCRRGGAVPLIAALLPAVLLGCLPLEQVALADEPAPFVPGEISIGEPLPLPARGAATPATPPFAPAPPFSPPAAPTAPAAPAIPARKAPPAAAGWFGWTLDDSVVTGRLVVAEVTADGPAARAGVRPQDILLAIDGHRLSSADEIAAALAAIPAGRAVPASVARASGIEEVVITPQTRPKPGATGRVAAVREAPTGAVTQAADWQPLSGAAAIKDTPAADGSRSVLAPPSSPLRRSPPPSLPSVAAPATASALASSPMAPPRRLDAGGPVGGRPALGVRTLPVDQATQSRFALPHASGALVIGVIHELPAARAGVPPGAVIVALDERPVESPEDLSRLVADGPVGTPLTVRYVLPGGRTQEAEVALERLAPAIERALAQPATLVPAPSTADE
ncbi:MAG: PDZ domain-containing protein [Pirellulales bacterium]